MAQQLNQREKEIRHLEMAMSQVRGELSEKENEVVKVREDVEKTKKASQVYTYDRVFISVLCTISVLDWYQVHVITRWRSWGLESLSQTHSVYILGKNYRSYENT